MSAKSKSRRLLVQPETVEPKESKNKVKPADIKRVEALTENQQTFFDIYRNGSPAIFLYGLAGTGKTFIALYKALQQVLEFDKYQRVVIVRSAVPSRDIGFLPGTEVEKTEVYIQPYIDICNKLLPRFEGKAYQRLKEQGLIEFLSTSFVRGLTIDNAIIIVDEGQNLNDQEFNSIITRLGEDSRIIFCGDHYQTDLSKRNDESGFNKFMAISLSMDSFEHVEFGIEDIVRGRIVREYLIAKMDYEKNLRSPAR